MKCMATWTSCGLAAAITAAAVLAPQLVGQAAPTSPVDDAVAAALNKAWGPGLVVDDSSSGGATACMGSAAQTVVYRRDRIVLRTTIDNAAAMNEVRRALADIGSTATVVAAERITLPPPPTGPPIVPIVSVSLSPAIAATIPVVALARRLHQRDVVVDAGLDYVLSPSSGPTFMWPDGFPEPAPSLPTPRAATIGAGTDVVVYDSGLASPTQSDHPANVVRLAPRDAEAVDVRPADGIADLYFAGHGVAIASVIATLAPGATVTEARITEANGVATDVSAARRMATTLRDADLRNSWPDVIVNAFGSPACDLDPTHPGDELAPVGLAAVTEAVDRHGESLVVASAGNRSTNRRFYPAAFPSVVAVGAVDGTADADGDPWLSASRSDPAASFSNYGSWVDAWAPGVDLVTNHIDGFRFEAGGDLVTGIASVDGTSFSAPYVAALVAERIAATGQDPDGAWLSIRASGARCSATVGSGVAVALPALTAAATTSPATGSVTAC